MTRKPVRPRGGPWFAVVWWNEGARRGYQSPLFRKQASAEHYRDTQLGFPEQATIWKLDGKWVEADG